VFHLLGATGFNGLAKGASERVTAAAAIANGVRKRHRRQHRYDRKNQFQCVSHESSLLCGAQREGEGRRAGIAGTASQRRSRASTGGLNRIRITDTKKCV